MSRCIRFYATIEGHVFEKIFGAKEAYRKGLSRSPNRILAFRSRNEQRAQVETEVGEVGEVLDVALATEGVDVVETEVVEHQEVVLAVVALVAEVAGALAQVRIAVRREGEEHLEGADELSSKVPMRQRPPSMMSMADMGEWAFTEQVPRGQLPG